MAPLRTVVANDGSIPSEELQKLAAEAGLTVVAESPRWDHLSELVETRSPDLALVCGDRGFLDGAPELPAWLPVVVLVPEQEDVQDFADSGAYTLLPSVPDPDWLGAVARLVVARAHDLSDARRDADDLRDQLETRKLVERAKGVLMNRLNLSEDEAYRRLQKASQDENRKLRDIAESVLRADKVFGLSPLKEPEPRRTTRPKRTPSREHSPN